MLALACSLYVICFNQLQNSLIDHPLYGILWKIHLILVNADGIVLLAPSWWGLQQLLDLVVQQSTLINMSLNTQKSVCMTFLPRDRSKVVSLCFPELCVNGEKLAYVKCFKYLGHIITDNNMEEI